MRIVGAILGCLFGLVFMAGGLFIAMETAVPTWQNWQRMQGWQQGQAQLVYVKGDDSKTEAEYRYSVNGEIYQNDRVYVADFNDNIGDYHTLLQARLQQKLQSRQPVTIWINPQIAAESVIDRDMRWGLFTLMTGFCSVFVLIGLGVVIGSIKGTGKTASGTIPKPSFTQLRHEWEQHQREGYSGSFIDYRRERLQAIERANGEEIKPQKLWSQRKGWDKPRIRSNARGGVWLMWFFALFWNGISSPLLFQFETEWSSGNYAILIGLIFPLVGLVIIILALRKTLEYNRFGVVEYAMDPYPGSIGGNVGGRIHLKRFPRVATSSSAELEAYFTVTLECVYSYVSGSGDNRSRHERVRWAEQGNPAVERVGHGLELVFRFDVPDDLPEADVEQSGDYYFWRLKVAGDLPGVDLDRHYNIPVYATGKRSRMASHDISLQYAEQKEYASEEKRQAIISGNFDETDLVKTARIQQAGDELSLYFPMLRHKGATVFAMIFAGGFGFASFSMLSEFVSASVFGIIGAVFAIPFVLVALVASLIVLYLPFTNLLMYIRSGELMVRRRWWYFPVSKQQLSGSDIRSLAIKNTSSTGQGVDKVGHYKITATLQSGKQITLAETIRGEDLAEHLKAYIADRLGVKEKF